MKNNNIQVEDIDSVEHVLETTGYTDVAKAYILYRKNRKKIRNMKSTILDYKGNCKQLCKKKRGRLEGKGEFNRYLFCRWAYSTQFGAITANYWLSEIYDEEVANAHRNADIHIHDLSMPHRILRRLVTLKQLIKDGLGGIPGKITSSPAKHLSTLCNQMVKLPWNNAE